MTDHRGLTAMDYKSYSNGFAHFFVLSPGITEGSGSPNVVREYIYRNSNVNPWDSVLYLLFIGFASCGIKSIGTRCRYICQNTGNIGPNLGSSFSAFENYFFLRGRKPPLSVTSRLSTVSVLRCAVIRVFIRQLFTCLSVWSWRS